MTSIWSWTASAYKQHQDRHERELRLRGELAERWNRLYYVTNNPWAEEAMSSNRAYFEVLLFGNSLPIRGVPASSQAPTILYPEFANLNLMALLDEIEETSKEQETKIAIKGLRFKLRKLEQLFTSSSEHDGAIADAKNLSSAVGEFQLNFRAVLELMGYQGDIALPPQKYLPDFKTAK